VFSKLLKQRNGAAQKRETIPRRGGTNICALSFAQERLWFTEQWTNERAVYNIPLVVRLSGALNLAALEASLDEIVRRHEVLRTTFVMFEGQPRQVIAPAMRLVLPVADLRGLAEAEREAEARRISDEQSQQTFNLSKGPLLRILALALDEREHVIVFTMHHILCDEWSMKVLTKEVSELYTAFSVGRPPSLPELPIQYADYAIWQRQWLEGAELERHLAYWREVLGGNLPVLNLPTDKPRPRGQTFKGATAGFRLPLEIAEALKDPQRHEGVTLFMTLLAAFVSLLYSYTGQQDIVVGTDVANRNRVETEDLIGFFSNQLVLRVNLSGEITFRELLGRVRETTLDAYAHQDLSFEKLVKALQTRRDPSRSPLFQVKFVLQNDPPTELDLEGLTLSPISSENRTAKFDLLITIVNQKQGLTGALEYNTDLWSAATIGRMLKNFETLLTHVVGDPDARLSYLKESLNEAERQQQLKEQEAVKDARHKKLRGIRPKTVSKGARVSSYEDE
jgi:hypothetical protein